MSRWLDGFHIGPCVVDNRCAAWLKDDDLLCRKFVHRAAVSASYKGDIMEAAHIHVSAAKQHFSIGTEKALEHSLDIVIASLSGPSWRQ